LPTSIPDKKRAMSRSFACARVSAIGQAREN
jgi:hypothetical protein